MRVAEDHTSAARVPKVVRDLLVYDQIVAGNEARVEAREVEALSTAVLVFVFTTPAIDDEAVPTMLFVLAFTAAVPAVIFAANDVEAFSTALFVLELTAVVLLVILAAREVEAVRTVALVFTFTAAVPAVILAAMDVEAFVTSD